VNPSCGTVALYGLFMNCFFLADHRAMDFTLSVAPLNSKFSQQNALWERSHVDNSFRYIFIYHFSYLLTYYYSFLAHYNKKCFDINWFHLLSPTISSLLVFSLWGHMTFERWLQQQKTCSVCLRFTAYFAQRFCLWNKIFSQPTVKNFTYINQKCYFPLWLFQLRWTLIQHIQVFHVNKPNTCFAVRVISQKSCDLKARIPQRQDGGTK
jgi:hypothetical protein